MALVRKWETAIKVFRTSGIIDKMKKNRTNFMTEELLTENTALKQKISELELENKLLRQEIKELSLELDKKRYSSLYRD